MTSSCCGRDSATPECFGRGSQGASFVGSSKLSLFFPELCSFRRVCCFPRFCKIWPQMFELLGFWFRRCLGAFLRTPLRHRAFLRSPTTTMSTYRVGLLAQANFSAQTFKPAHKARAGQRAALSVQSAAAAMQHLEQRSTSELSP